MVSDVGSYYKGAYPIPELMKLTFRGLIFWYRIMEREIIERNILYDLGKKDKPTPAPQTLRRMVDKKIRELKGVGREDGVTI